MGRKEKRGAAGRAREARCILGQKKEEGEGKKLLSLGTFGTSQLVKIRALNNRKKKVKKLPMERAEGIRSWGAKGITVINLRKEGNHKRVKNGIEKGRRAKQC